MVLMPDGYPMHDVVMTWKGNSSSEAIYGVEEVEIPQFTVVDYRLDNRVETVIAGWLRQTNNRIYSRLVVIVCIYSQMNSRMIQILNNR